MPDKPHKGREHERTSGNIAQELSLDSNIDRTIPVTSYRRKASPVLKYGVISSWRVCCLSLDQAPLARPPVPVARLFC